MLSDKSMVGASKRTLSGKTRVLIVKRVVRAYGATKVKGDV